MSFPISRGPYDALDAAKVAEIKKWDKDKEAQALFQAQFREFIETKPLYSNFKITLPRGVAFLAGPTGVGKTELAKTITELLFGDKSAYIRFDMSEFSAEHADQRLIGAPPGYVGYDVGGELTNAIREKPFSVVLFDEIEKARIRAFSLVTTMCSSLELYSQV